MTTQKLPKVFIVGESGTTGLRLHDRLISRSDIELLSLPDEKRKDIPTIVEYAKNADLMFLCLPDDASREIVKATEGTGIRILDTSTAHRTKEDWVYGFPELSSEQYKAISQAQKVAVPGCHASGPHGQHTQQHQREQRCAGTFQECRHTTNRLSFAAEAAHGPAQKIFSPVCHR